MQISNTAPFKEEKVAAHPVCGKCHSSAVYADRDQFGNVDIVCLMCGNRYPGGEGFYMSNEEPNADNQTAVKSEAIMEEKEETTKAGRLCARCGINPPISDKHPYCASCMAKMGAEKRKMAAKTDRRDEISKKMKEDLSPVEKTSQKSNMKVVVDFSGYSSIFEQIQELAKEQIRPPEAQILFLLKSYLGSSL